MPNRSFPFVSAAVFLAIVSLSGIASAQTTTKTFIDYFQPTPIQCPPLTSDTWGVAGVLPRDTCNGIESSKGAGVPPDWYYWDGKIIRAKDGIYHMIMSTWPGTAPFHPGWTNSEAFHAVSSGGVLGPYKRQGYVYTNNGSHKGHNVSAAELLDGTYAVVVSEIVPFTIYKASSLDGPWTACPNPTGELIKENGVKVGTDKKWDSNVSLTARHDGRFQIVQRQGLIAIADTLCGPYLMQKPTWTYAKENLPSIDSVYPHRTSPGTHEWEEDPVIWYSGGRYHVMYNSATDRVGHEVSSPDGIHDWKDGGVAIDARLSKKLFSYEGSTTAPQWYNLERPGVLLENGHITHVTFAVTDVEKMTLQASGNHGSKIVVVPFDGVAFDRDNGWIDTGGLDGGALTDGGGKGGAHDGGNVDVAGAGGSKATGGAGGTGGIAATGGAQGSGGATATTGTQSGSGGNSGASTSSATGGSITASTGNAQSPGCSCRVGAGSVRRGELGLALALLLVASRRPRRLRRGLGSSVGAFFKQS